MIAARILGPPEITVDGALPPAELLWRKHLGLCLVLWCASERRRTRDQLIGLLWADKDERAARHSLNEALRVVRRAAGDAALDTSAESVRWVADIDLDLDRFASLETTDPDGACVLIAGPFCDGFIVPGAEDFDQWLEGERARWRHRSVAVLVRSAAAAEDRGDTDRALVLAERALAIDPHGELAVQAAVRAYWLRGDRAAALATGEAYRARLARDLGVTPDAKTASLLARVAGERGPVRPPGAVMPAQRVPLVARESELRQLLDAWRAAVAGRRPAMLIINGVSGSGRSRLIDEFNTRAVIAGATAIMLRAVDVDGSDDHAVLLGLAASGLHLAPGIAGAALGAIAAFATRMPDWADRFSGPSTSEPLPLREAFTAIVRAAAEERPVVLAIDDAERMHPGELLWLAALIRAMSGLPMTLVLTLNTGAGTEAVDELLRSAGGDITGASVKLEPFQLADLQQLVGAILADWPEEAQARLARRLMAESAGAPGIAVDVIEAVLHGLALDGSAHWPQPDRTLDATLPAPLPDSLIAAIRLAFRRLPADEQAMLSTAALLGEPFSAELLGRVLGLADAAHLDAHLDALEWERWIVADGRGYSFPARAKRRLIVDELMTPGHRRRLEARIAACN